MQTEYRMYSTPFLIGQRADTAGTQIDSYAAEKVIEFGAAVKRGTNKSTQCLPLDDIESGTFLGIALRNDLQRTGSIEAKSMVSVMTKGRVAVKTTEAVEAGDKAYVHADGTFNKTSEEGLEIGVFHSTQAEEDNLGNFGD